MKKITLLLSAILIFTLSFYSCEESQIDPTDPESTVLPFTSLSKDAAVKAMELSCGDIVDCPLNAGSKVNVIGNVEITNDNEYLYIKVYSSIGFKTNEDNNNDNLKIYVGTYLDEDIFAGNGAPIPGKFNYKTHVDENTYTMRIELGTIKYWNNEETNNKCGPNLFVIVHADIPGEDSTAFGGCIKGDGPRWWSYTEYTPVCCCFCGFSFDNQNEDGGDACLTLPYMGTAYKFWSSSFDFDVMNNPANANRYEVSLVANAKTCTPLNADGEKMEGENYETIVVGKAILDVYSGGDGGTERFVNITYELKDKYKYYNIQVDLYIGADQKPLGWDVDGQTIKTDDKHKLFQAYVISGETTYIFTGIPWLTHEDSSETFIALHAAIGDCPMPSFQ